MEILWRSPAGDSDLGVLAELNLMLIQDEGHRNSMGLAELQDRMAGWLDSEYEATILSTGDADNVAYALWAARPEHVYLRQF